MAEEVCTYHDDCFTCPYFRCLDEYRQYKDLKRQDVLFLSSQGFSENEVGKLVNVSRRTVRNYRRYENIRD